jgi:hypothetical protein
LYTSLLLSIKHESFSLIFLAAVLAFFLRNIHQLHKERKTSKNGVFKGQMNILKEHNKANISRGQTPLFFSAKRNNVSKESAKEKNNKKQTQKINVKRTKKPKKKPES